MPRATCSRWTVGRARHRGRQRGRDGQVLTAGGRDRLTAEDVEATGAQAVTAVGGFQHVLQALGVQVAALGLVDAAHLDVGLDRADHRGVAHGAHIGLLAVQQAALGLAGTVDLDVGLDRADDGRAGMGGTGGQQGGKGGGGGEQVFTKAK